MKLEDQVCSLELAKKLKKLGVKQDGLFYYGAFENPLYGICNESDAKEDHWRIFYSLKNEKISPDYYCSAFTASELGEMLREFELNHKYYEIDSYNTYDGYNLILKTTKQLNISSLYVCDHLESNVRAKILIYLIENKLMEIPK